MKKLILMLLAILALALPGPVLASVSIDLFSSAGSVLIATNGQPDISCNINPVIAQTESDTTRADSSIAIAAIINPQSEMKKGITMMTAILLAENGISESSRIDMPVIAVMSRLDSKDCAAT